MLLAKNPHDKPSSPTRRCLAKGPTHGEGLLHTLMKAFNWQAMCLSELLLKMSSCLYSFLQNLGYLPIVVESFCSYCSPNLAISQTHAEISHGSSLTSVQLLASSRPCHRNVCLHDFPTSLDSKVEAIFLDLPAPWEVVPFLHSTLDPTITTMACCFSPCIEQVLKTVKALNAMGWHDVETYESLVRTHESLKGGGPPEMPLRGVEEVKHKLRMQEKKRERVSEKQRARARERKAKEEAAQNRLSEMVVKTEEVEDEEEDELDEDGDEERSRSQRTRGSTSSRGRTMVGRLSS